MGDAALAVTSRRASDHYECSSERANYLPASLLAPQPWVMIDAIKNVDIPSISVLLRQHAQNFHRRRGGEPPVIPMIVALALSFSSGSVVGNALRLRTRA